MTAIISKRGSNTMKQIVLLIAIAVAVTGCSHRYSKYGYEPPSQSQQTNKH
jgi:hypothetical protein